jgi:hypothetical protein
VLTYSAKGFSFDEIASMLGLSRHTVMTYVKRSYRKLQVHSRPRPSMRPGWASSATELPVGWARQLLLLGVALLILLTAAWVVDLPITRWSRSRRSACTFSR